MSEGATASDSPFIKGRNARLYGNARASCPYTEGTPDHAAWMEAYDEAGDDRLERQTGTVDPQADVKSSGARGSAGSRARSLRDSGPTRFRPG